MKVKFYAIALLAMLLLSGLVSLPVGPMAEETEMGPGVWSQTRYFIGYIGNLTPANHDDVNLSQVLRITGMDTNTTPHSTLGPWPVYFNDTTLEFSAEVDLDFHDYTMPWMIQLYDRYGWNETGGGTVLYPMPQNFVKSIPSPEYLPNGTLDYLPGVFGSMSLKIINLSSGAPLRDVGLEFPSHGPFNSAESGLYTDANGDVLFEDMQVGIEGSKNKITIRFNKQHFNTMDGTGFEERTLKVGETVSYEIGLKEDPLVRSFFPADGSTGIKTNGNQAGLFVQFHTPMNTSTVNSETLFIEKVGGSKVDLDYSWGSGDQLVYLIPTSDLEYNTSYRLKVLPRVLNLTNNETLWRTFSTTFRTWEEPSVVSGTVHINGTSDPAPEGTTVKVDNNPIELTDGYFSVEVKENTDHTITVWGPSVGGVDEYLYYGDRSTPYEFNIPRGTEDIVEGLVVHRRETRAVVINVQDEDGTIMEGVKVTQFITGEMQETNEFGEARFEDVRMDLSTPFKTEYPNYYDSSFSILPGTDDPTTKVVMLMEKPLPVEIMAIGEVYLPLDNNIIEVDNYIRLDFQNNMDVDTMTSDNIKVLGPGSVPVLVDVFNETESFKRWRVVPRSDLAYNTHYTLFISEQIAEIGGNNPLWRDVSIPFSTEKLPTAAVNGRVLINGKGVEGVRIEVYHEDVLLDFGYSEVNGAYLVDIEMNVLQLFPVTIVANGTEIGLTTRFTGQRTLKAGFAINNTDFDLERLPDWITVVYPKDQMGRMLISGAITIRFQEELQDTDPVSFLENFTFGSPPVDIDIELSDDKKTVTIHPDRALDHDTSYVLSISNFPDGEFNRELLTYSGLKALIRGEVIEIMTELKPIEVLLTNPTKEEMDAENVKVDTQIYIYFTNYTVNRTLVESRLEMVKVNTNTPVGNLTFNWATNGRSVGIEHDDFELLTEYMIALPEGAYGTNGARLRVPFLIYFTTETKTIDINPISSLPADHQEPGLITVTATNSLGRAIRISVSIRPVSTPNAQFEEISNFTLAALEERQVQLDFTGRENGEYQVLFRVFDGVKGTLLNEYTRSIYIEDKEDANGGLSLLIIIVVVAVILIVVVLGIFLYMQSRKKDIEEELKEEFECPECHNLVSSDDTVCPHCGAEFEEEAYKCPKCGNMLGPDDEECSECGYDFSDQDKIELDEDEEGDISEDYEEEDMDLDEDESDMELDEDEDLEEMEDEKED
ncbi:MAG: Ig-like domain-containing protein [Candidatus Thermoplasmatota archaeon]|nr:Ig-like domain-containing protein [Candidatus Thermoplasmatota archaeon]